ncbi:MAG TPA: hypothetical protein VMH04_11265 [Candidatus Solibacter sp.]|nr:hypothetical protein [Candidatus Solibacter sp.]
MQLPSSRPKARSQSALNSKLESKLWVYAAAAGAAGIGLLVCNPAEAKVVVTKANTVIKPTVALDFNHDGIIDFNLTKWGATNGSAVASYVLVCHDELLNLSHQCISSTNDPNAGNLVREVSSNFSGAADLPFGANIGPGNKFGGAGKAVLMAERYFFDTASGQKQYWFGPWANNGEGASNRYLGFKFKIGSQFHYGWARVTVTYSTESGLAAVLTGYAYETIPGKAIRAGITTGTAAALEPALTPSMQQKDSNREASLGMLSLGCTGLSIWRREDS